MRAGVLTDLCTAPAGSEYDMGAFSMLNMVSQRLAGGIISDGLTLNM